MKNTKALIVTGAIFDLGIIVVPAAEAQNARQSAPAVQPASPAGGVPTNGYYIKMSSAMWEKQSNAREAAIKACSVKGGTVVKLGTDMVCRVPDATPGK